MEFVHLPFNLKETIAAIATPPGEGGIAIIRLSGSAALQIAEKIFSGPVSKYASHTAHLGHVKNAEGRKVDEALLLIMRAPRSFTGEDIIEFQCHGGMIASKKVLGACLEAGARLARPGEFTFRAFMNGKMDLTQAEAVQKLIGAKSELSYELASRHLEGGFGKKISLLQEKLVEFSAILEAWVDFPEEGLEFISLENILLRLELIASEMHTLLASFQDGKKLDCGISLCLLGAPNAGKSSLLNALLDEERAIVTPVAGTTRDILQEEIFFGGLYFKLIDTAGIRNTEEEIEKEGIRRSKKAALSADLILLIVDASVGVSENDFHFLPRDKTLLVWNKTDLPLKKITKTSYPHAVEISAQKRCGLDALKAGIEKIIWEKGVPDKEEAVLFSARHKCALQKAFDLLNQVIEGLKAEISPEFLAQDLRFALMELGTIIGRNVQEDVLSSIFSQFCIGK